MDSDRVIELVSKIRGCTFASLDAKTQPKPGLVCRITDERVMLFCNRKSSGYENMVRRRLARLGKNPDAFKVGPLPWGERLEGTPLIIHRNKYYLQTIQIKEGVWKYYLGEYPVKPENFGILPRQAAQGLPVEDQVIINTYALSSLTRLRVMGVELLAPK